MKKYIKPFFLVLFNNVFLLMLNTPDVCKNSWSLILFALLWFISFSKLVVGIRYTALPKNTNEYLKYSFVDNGILLKTSKIKKDGFYEIWRQQNDEHSIQILCFNERTGDFQAFDRFYWMNEPIYNRFTGVDDWEEDLWTPIKLHYTEKWLKEHLISNIN